MSNMIYMLTLEVLSHSIGPTQMLHILERLFKRRKIYSQLKEYTEWTEEKFPISIGYRSILIKFIDSCKKNDIKEISVSDVQDYLEDVKVLSTVYQHMRTGIAIRSFLRYFHARKSKVISPNIPSQEGDNEPLQVEKKREIIEEMRFVKMNRGRPPCIEQIKTVKRLCDKEHMTYEQVGRILKKNKSSICRWYHYDLAKYEKEETLR